jgi:hypothetical protein
VTDQFDKLEKSLHQINNDLSVLFAALDLAERAGSRRELEAVRKRLTHMRESADKIVHGLHGAQQIAHNLSRASAP